jgi:manganese/zinc/iron transport system permease protein
MSGLDAFLTHDFPMLGAGVLASIACALVGCFLVLRKMSLMGDAISHAVLPGIIAAFLLAGTIKAMPIFLGAVVVGVLTALLTQIIHRYGRIESGASMGVVFTILFAIGVIMLEHTHAGSVHLDADCVLYGQMESVLWLPGSHFPRQISTLAIVAMFNATVIIALFKEFRLAAFDPGLAPSQGISAGFMHYLLMTMTAITVIASFEAVGSILVVAMLIVPGVIAHLFTNRLGAMLIFAVIVSIIAAGGGYGAAVAVNANAAGMIGVTLGVLLAIATAFAPHGGWMWQLRRERGIAGPPKRIA